jgi:hypothetical protein
MLQPGRIPKLRALASLAPATPKRCVDPALDSSEFSLSRNHFGYEARALPARMSVPKAFIDKNNYIVPSEHNVGGSGKVYCM